MVIYKYKIGDEFYDDGTLTIDMPENTRILFVDTQDGIPYLWAMHEATAPTFPHKFIVYGTGHVFDESLCYVGSWQQHLFVWHLFEDR